ncbi:MAG: Fic family protein [Candidatus Margulisbacteria bacterium]|jgi:Fic family protein|nr:Fic family protein [Candidatus Margulisiibacteriota bacterium]
MRPPYEITPQILKSTAEITELLGSLSGALIAKPDIKLRRRNRIKTIKSSLAIEGNTFTEEQITALLDGKRVLGSPREITEVQNALKLYADLPRYRPDKIKDFLSAHGVLMRGLVKSAGRWRSVNVGVVSGTKVIHVAPKPLFVPKLMQDLFDWLKIDKATHYLIKGAVVHYEIEFIHPFEDGNGRMGRFWQSALLTAHNSIFEYLPVESLIEQKQQQYYRVLEKCGQQGRSTLFIEFILQTLKESLAEYAGQISGATSAIADRLAKAAEVFQKNNFSRKDYLTLFKTISTATASRDLSQGVQQNLLQKSGDKNNTRYKFQDTK